MPPSRHLAHPWRRSAYDLYTFSSQAMPMLMFFLHLRWVPLRGADDVLWIVQAGFSQRQQNAAE